MNEAKALETTVQDLPASFNFAVSDELNEGVIKSTLISEIIYNSRYFDETIVDPNSLVVEVSNEGGFKKFTVKLSLS